MMAKFLPSRQVQTMMVAALFAIQSVLTIKFPPKNNICFVQVEKWTSQVHLRYLVRVRVNINNINM
jgi:hypothetical protein